MADGWSDLPGTFNVRHPYRLWTSRRYINGVTDLTESAMADALLEGAIEGVMTDIKSILLANASSEYEGWTDITLVPRAVKRATTYGVIASLYLRSSFASKDVLPFLDPVRPITMDGGTERRAAEHWESKMEEMIGLYLETTGPSKFWVSTADEEPVFTMEDLPHSSESEP